MLRTMCRTVPALVVAGLVSLTIGVSGQTGAKDPVAEGTTNGQWPTYAGNLDGWRYSPLDQITADNFNKLEVAWRLKTDNFGNRPEFKLEGTPLMVGGVLYTTAGNRRSAIAIDAATGEVLWVHGEREGNRGATAPRQLSGRGLAYWSGRQERRARRLLHARLPDGRARRQDRPARADLRQGRHRRSEGRHGPGRRSRQRRGTR